MIELYKGSRRNIYMKVSRRLTNEDFTIQSVTCRVIDNKGNVIESGITGEINNDLKRVYYDLDTRDEKYLPKRDYWVEFQVSVQGTVKLIIGRVLVKILE